MKKIKLITTFSILGTISGIVAPMTSCAPTIDTYTISLYSDTGSFEHNNKLISIGNIEKGSSLGSLKGYAEPTMQGKRFVCWTDVDGNVWNASSTITKSMLLKANYDDFIEEPKDFKTDSWATLTNVCNQEGFLPFANAYCLNPGEEPFTDESLAYNRIKDKITPIYKTDYSYYYEGLVKPITITFDNVQYQSNIRLIGINQDYLSETLQKAKFTFAFTDCIDAAAYDIRGVGVWYYKQGGIEHNCFLRKYLNEYLIDTLPIAIRNNIKTVKKYNGCYDITEPLTVKYVGDISQSDEKLFPLSLDEMNLPPELVTWALQNYRLSNNSSLSADNSGPIYSYYKRMAVYDDGHVYYTNLDWSSLMEELPEEQLEDMYQGFCWGYLHKHLFDTPAYLDYWIRTGALGEGESIVQSALAFYENENGQYSVHDFVCPNGVNDIALGIAPAFCI